MEDLKVLFPVHIREKIKNDQWFDGLEEIRIRVGQPIELEYADETRYLLDVGGKMCTCVREGVRNAKECTRITGKDIAEMLSYISKYSLYAYQEELRQGYLTIEGGHRIGIAGEAAKDGEGIAGIKHISFLNIRVAHEKKGCAEKILPYLKDEKNIYNTLLVSKPGAGKTTCLRDCIRSLSDGTEDLDGMKICVVDERSEIAACHLGIPQNDMGMRTDVLTGCSKSEGMMLMLRSMSPQIIAVDELGRKEDFRAVEQAACSGVRILGTVHADAMEELWEKPYLKKWMKKEIFKRFILILRSRSGEREFQVFNGKREQLC